MGILKVVIIIAMKPKELWPNVLKFPEWFPTDIPARLKKMLVQFTPHRDGWQRRHKQSIIFVSKKTPLHEIEVRWQERASASTEKAKDTASAIKAKTGSNLTDLSSAFFESMDARVDRGLSLEGEVKDGKKKTGGIKPMAWRTRKDYTNDITAFIVAVGDVSCRELSPIHGDKWAGDLSGIAATSWDRKIAAVHAMVRWGLRRGFFNDNVALRHQFTDRPVQALLGDILVKSPHAYKRDERMDKSLCYEIYELRALWNAADELEKLWICFGMNGAFDDSDIDRLTDSDIDYERCRVDFRRSKTGKVRRVCPLLPETMRRIKSHVRIDPQDQSLIGRLFITPSGLSYYRASASGSPCYYIPGRWSALMRRAGIKAKFKYVTDPKTKKPKIVREKYNGPPRGFRNLRTTFANLVPPGFTDELEIIMGHGDGGGVLIGSYLENRGLERLEELTRLVWHRFRVCDAPMGGVCRCPDPLSIDVVESKK